MTNQSAHTVSVVCSWFCCGGLEAKQNGVVSPGSVFVVTAPQPITRRLGMRQKLEFAMQASRRSKHKPINTLHLQVRKCHLWSEVEVVPKSVQLRYRMHLNRLFCPVKDTYVTSLSLKKWLLCTFLPFPHLAFRKPTGPSAHLWHIGRQRKRVRITERLNLKKQLRLEFTSFPPIHHSSCFLYVRRAIHSEHLKYEQFHLWQNKINKWLTINHAHRRSKLHYFPSHSLHHGRREIHSKMRRL